MEQAVRRAAVRATLAPSVHNTQPWRFMLSGSSLEVHADWSRRLQVLDPRGRQLLISCGCAVFNARVAVAAAGYEVVVDRFANPGQPTLLARLTLHDHHDHGVPAGIACLDSAVELRRTNRQSFVDEAMPGPVIEALVAGAEAEGAELLPISAAAQTAVTSLLSRQAEVFETGDPAYRAELRAWTSADAGRLDGVTTAGPDFGADGTYRLQPDPESDAPQCWLLLGTRQDTPASWLRAGEALERVLLDVTRRGYAVSLLTQLVEVAETNGLLRSQLQLAMYPHVLLRVGRAPATVVSRRRRLVDMIEHSR